MQYNLHNHYDYGFNSMNEMRSNIEIFQCIWGSLVNISAHLLLYNPIYFYEMVFLKSTEKLFEMKMKNAIGVDHA